MSLSSSGESPGYLSHFTLLEELSEVLNARTAPLALPWPSRQHFNRFTAAHMACFNRFTAADVACCLCIGDVTHAHSKRCCVAVSTLGAIRN